MKESVSKSINLLEAINISLVSIFIVFFILFLIATILYSLKYIPSFSSKENKIVEKQKNENKNNIESKKLVDINELKDEEAKIAAMIALIEASNDEKNSNMKVISIKQL